MKKTTSKDCFILFWTALKYVKITAPIVLTCSLLAAVSICGFFANHFKQTVHRMLLVILIHDGIKLGGKSVSNCQYCWRHFCKDNRIAFDFPQSTNITGQKFEFIHSFGL